MNSILQNVPLWGCDDDACSVFLLCGRPIHMYHLEFSLDIFVFREGEFCYEICQCLGFYSRPRAIFYIELAELNGPLYHPSSGFRFIHCFINGLVYHYYNWVSLKVWTKFSGGHYYGKGNLFYPRVSGFSSLESLADVIHRELYLILFSDQGSANYSCRHCYVEEEVFSLLRRTQEWRVSQVTL